jgi:hypothetical protein
VLEKTLTTLTLDSGSNVNVFTSTDLVDEVRECEEVITGIGGREITAQQVGRSRWGTTFIVPENGLNLVSLAQARKVAQVSLIENAAAFVAEFSDGEKFIFNFSEGLYDCEVDIPQTNFTHR